jgi:hypothetical protein
VEPTECWNLNHILLKFGSLFPLDLVSSSLWINKLYKGYTAFTVILFFSVSSRNPLFIFCTDYSLEDGIEVMSIFLTQVRSGTKIIIWRYFIQKRGRERLVSSVKAYKERLLVFGAPAAIS